ncbi:MAG: hypothetical protein KBE65_22680 [Phycisphaerae bacterium]|nr:hypothetical protein [Phycisphaerae bacterium]
MRQVALLRAMWRRWSLIVLATIVGLGGGYLCYRTLRPTYTCTARLVIEKSSGCRWQWPPVEPGSHSFFQAQAALLTSPTIVGEALRDPNAVAISGSHAGSRLPDVIRSLTATVGKDRVVIVSASSRDPNTAAVVVNAVVRAYRRWIKAPEGDGVANDLWSRLQRELETTREALLKKRQELMVLEQRNPALRERGQREATAKTLDDLSGERNTARLRVVERESHCAMLRELESDPNLFRDYVVSHELRLDDSERAGLAEALSSLRSAFAAVEPNGSPQIDSPQENGGQFDRETMRRYIAPADTLCEDAKAREQAAHYELLRAECHILEAMYERLLEMTTPLNRNGQLAGSQSS